MTEYFIDVHPSYQPRVDWKLVKAAGITGIIVKSGAGLTNYSYFHDYVKKAKDEGGFIVGAYHWTDPIYGAEAQVNTIAKTEALEEVDFTANDYEQWWSNWGKWYEAIRGKIPMASVPRFDKNKLGQYLGLFNKAAKQKLIKPHVLYTANWFIQSYTSGTAPFINDFKLWTASYPYAPGRETVSWEEFFTKRLPSANAKPVVPQGSNLSNVLIWQFTGDKFMLPGVYSDVQGTKRSPLDVNMVLGNLNDFLKRKEKVEEPVTCPSEDRLSDIENKLSLIKNSVNDVQELLLTIESDLDKVIKK